MHATTDRPKHHRGFTLIELAIVLAVGGFLIVGMSRVALNYIANSQLAETERKMTQVTQALQRFIDINKRLPCPASLTASIDTAHFGVESSADCSTDIAGTYEVNGRGGRDVRIGALPTRSLNIGDDFQLDGWDNRFIYAVTSDLTQVATFNPKEGAISVVDSNDNPVFVPAQRAQYVLLSTGQNANGAFTRHGKRSTPCNTAAPEGENCDLDDSTFRTTIRRSSDSSGVQSFDDFVSYALLDIRNVRRPETAIIPPNTISAFDLESCPAGWSYMPELAGRAIVATGTLYRGEVDIAGTGRYGSTSYNLRLQRGFATMRMNPNSISYTIAFDTYHRHPLVTSTITNILSNPTSTIPIYVANTASGGNFPFSTNSVGGGSDGLPALQENRQPFYVYTYCKKD